MMWRWLTFGALLCAASGAAAAAPSKDIPFRVDATLAPSCPPADRLLDEVRARAHGARVAASGETARGFRVDVVAEPRGVSGTLTALDGVADPRSVRGATCDEVMGALALTLALALDPEASVEPLPAASAKPTASAWRVSAGAEAVGYVTPVVLLGASLGVEHGRSPSGAALRASLRFVDSAAFDGAADARLSLATAALQVCPLRWGGKSAGIRPCFAVEGGALVGRSRSVDRPRTSTSPWIDGVLSLRGDLSPGPLALEAEAGLVGAATRVRLTEAPPERVVAATRWLGFVASVRVAYRFP